MNKFNCIYKKYLLLTYKPKLAHSNKGHSLLQVPRIKSITTKYYPAIDFWYTYYTTANMSALIIQKINTLNKLPLLLILYLTGPLKGIFRYIPSTKSVISGTILYFNSSINLQLGSIYQLQYIPIGSTLHHVEYKTFHGAAFARSSGTFIQLLGISTKFAIIKLPSNEIRKVLKTNYGILGVNEQICYNKSNYTKAGSFKFIGKKFIVRGVAKNAIDHPHGGGKGKSRVGRKYLCNFKGKITSGKKTRKTKSSLIITYKKI